MSHASSDRGDRSHLGLTVMIWALSLASLAVAALVTTEFVLVPVSLDIGEMINAGADPWWDAAEAAGLFTALLIVTGISLRLWHSVRFKALAWVLTAVEVGAVGWTSFVVYRDYF